MKNNTDTVEILMVCPFCKGKKKHKYQFNDKRIIPCTYCNATGKYWKKIDNVLEVNIL